MYRLPMSSPPSGSATLPSSSDRLQRPTKAVANLDDGAGGSSPSSPEDDPPLPLLPPIYLLPCHSV